MKNRVSQFLVTLSLFSISQIASADWMAMAIGANKNWAAITQADTQEEAENYVLKECSKSARQPCHLEFSSEADLRLVIATNGDAIGYAVGKDNSKMYDVAEAMCNKQRKLLSKKCIVRYANGNGAAASKVFINGHQFVKEKTF